MHTWKRLSIRFLYCSIQDVRQISNPIDSCRITGLTFFLRVHVCIYCTPFSAYLFSHFSSFMSGIYSPLHTGCLVDVTHRSCSACVSVSYMVWTKCAWSMLSLSGLNLIPRDWNWSWRSKKRLFIHVYMYRVIMCYENCTINIGLHFLGSVKLF